MKALFLLALPIFAIDQATKWWIIARSERLADWRQTVIADFFTLCYAENTGAAFSAFHGQNNLFIVISLVALIGIVVAVRRGVFRDALSRTGIGLLVGGVLGNLTDRIVHGHVVDFLLFDLHVPYANPFAVFNVADSAICIAAGLFIIGSFFAHPPSSAQEPPTGADQTSRR